MALFQIEGSFNITGRGFFIVGDILKGTIQIGDKFSFRHEMQEYTYCIKSIDFGRRSAHPKDFIGLSFPDLDEEIWKSVKVVPQIAEVFKET